MAIFAGLGGEAGAAARRQAAGSRSAGLGRFCRAAFAPKGKRVGLRSATEKRKTWKTHPIEHG